jgi:hypothetical protein
MGQFDLSLADARVVGQMRSMLKRKQGEGRVTGRCPLNRTKIHGMSGAEAILKRVLLRDCSTVMSASE